MDEDSKLKQNNKGNGELKLHQIFYSIEDLNLQIKSFEETNFVQLWKKDARSLETAAKRVPLRILKCIRELQYFTIAYSCKFGGRKLIQKENQLRLSKSFKWNCPFELVLKLSSDGQALEVTRICTDHNHEISQDLYQHLPRQRHLEDSLTEEVKRL